MAHEKNGLLKKEIPNLETIIFWESSRWILGVLHGYLDVSYGKTPFNLV